MPRTKRKQPVFEPVTIVVSSASGQQLSQFATSRQCRCCWCDCCHIKIAAVVVVIIEIAVNLSSFGIFAMKVTRAPPDIAAFIGLVYICFPICVVVSGVLLLFAVSRNTASHVWVHCFFVGIATVGECCKAILLVLMLAGISDFMSSIIASTSLRMPQGGNIFTGEDDAKLATELELQEGKADPNWRKRKVMMVRIDRFLATVYLVSTSFTITLYLVFLRLSRALSAYLTSKARCAPRKKTSQSTTSCPSSPDALLNPSEINFGNQFSGLRCNSYPPLQVRSQSCIMGANKVPIQSTTSPKFGSYLSAERPCPNRNRVDV